MRDSTVGVQALACDGKIPITSADPLPIVAAYYGYPKGAKKVPGIVQIHGGGQRASKIRVESWKGSKNGKELLDPIARRMLGVGLEKIKTKP
jgi:hypothetical protein